MKLDRLLEITILLMNRENVTAGELAERFGVSVRTVYRDVETLSLAGIPVAMSRGRGGGISLMKDFTLSRSIVTGEERDSILLSLQAFQATRYPDGDRALEKLSGLFRRDPSQWVRIDFSPWESGPGSEEKLRLIRQAILEYRVVRMDYVNSGNRRSSREIEPLLLFYKAHSWYLSAWCRERRGFRTFRFSRIRRLSLTGERFQPRPEPQSVPGWTGEFHGESLRLVAQFRQQAASRLYDDFDERLLTENADGTITLRVDFWEDEWVYGYLLSFGENVRVLEPPRLRALLRERIRAMQKNYEEPDKVDIQLSASLGYTHSQEEDPPKKRKDGDVMMENGMKFCQSCAMPLTSDEVKGTEKDGSRSEDYCAYCYKDGAFLGDCTMEEMIESCIEPCLKEHVYPDAETARQEMRKFFPMLKRWQKA